MTQYDPSAQGPGRRYSQDGRYPVHPHTESSSRPPEVPDPHSVPTDWSPSGTTHAGSAYAGYGRTTGEPGGAPAAWLSAPREPGGAHAAWEQWNHPAVPDSVPPSWTTSSQEQPTARWNTPARNPEPSTAAWNAAASEPSTAAWNTPASAPSASGWNGAGRRTNTDFFARSPVAPAATPATGTTADRGTRKNPKLTIAVAMIAAALAGGGVGAGIMAAVGGESAASAPAAPTGDQAPAAQPSAGSN